MYHYLRREFVGATQFHKGGSPKAPPPIPPPIPSTAAENASKSYRETQRRRALGFSQTILTGGMAAPGQQLSQPGKTLLGS